MSKREYKVEGIEKCNPNNYGGMVSRAISLVNRAEKSIDWEKGIDTIATSENPALVIDWERWQVVREILPMRYREAPASGKVPLLDSHNRSSVDKVKGSAKAFTIDGINLMCKTFVSGSDPVTRQKIEEGHIDSVSIGYKTDSSYTVEVPKGAEVSIDGKSYRNDFNDGYPLLVRTWWQEHELSLVPIGADATAKFKSAGEFENHTLLEKIEALTNEIKSLRAESGSFKKGDKVKVKGGSEHMADHKGMTMTVEEVSSEKAISVKMEDGTIHKWYVGSELEKTDGGMKENNEPEKVKHGLTYHEAQVRLLKYM